MKLTDYKALTFDCYGTLIDWESGITEGLKPLTDRMKTPPSRDTVLQAHSRLESTHQAQTPAKRYSDLLATIYRRLAEEWGLTVDWKECLTYGQSVANWPAFPDSAKALAYLKEHYKLVILSNVDNASFEHSRAKLGVDFDAIYTAEDVGSYKPSDTNFAYMLDNLAQLGIGKEDILHTAESLFHDHIPAGQQGLATCWIFRRHDQEGYGATRDPGAIPPVDFRFNSMAELVEAHRRESAP